jgi:pSer/pThr/pTyr-binding forkhead associated (FHA) protein
LESTSVSPSHAVLMSDAAGMLLLNLESADGTLLNGLPAPVDEPVRLKDGDEIRFGRVLARYAAPPDQWSRCSC